MKWLLDTNAASRFLRGDHPNLSHNVDKTPDGDLYLCSIVKAELLYGACKAPQPSSVLARLNPFFLSLPSVDFNDAAALEYGKLHHHLSIRGNRIGPNDVLIASIALANNFILVTNNTREFSRVPGLTIEDWQE
jgi:tRNA(fMet)-specific endonuclease VapC